MASKTEAEFTHHGTSILRKKVSRALNSAAQENRHLISIPYNKANRLSTPDDIRRVFALVGMGDIVINSMPLYQQALVHRSYLSEALSLSDEQLADAAAGTADPGLDADLARSLPALVKEGYLRAGENLARMVPLQATCCERLEYLGDSVCGCSVAKYIFARYPDQDEGFATRLRTKLVCGTKLAEFSDKLGLAPLIVMSRYQELIANGRSNTSILEDAFESFVGALFVDTAYDFALCDRFMTGVLETFQDFTHAIMTDTNWKDILLRFFQSNHAGAFPRYTLLDESFVNGQRIYHVGVYDPTGVKIIGSASAVLKKTAEQNSSKKALEYYKAL
jgi:ribonuclease-3